MKLISWNVNGLRACVGKGFLDFVDLIDADVICLQETKLQPHQIELDLPQYHIYWNSADKKGYSGTAGLKWFVFGFLRSISSCATFKSPQ